MGSRDWKYHLLIVITVGAACALFLWQAIRLAGGVGFPLDDAWIHARFADNLANGYGFSYNPGIPSPGSTSPLWVLLLAATYLLGIPPIPAALFWGILLLILSCWATHYLAFVVSQNRSVAVVAAVLTALMARLIWGAASGMEVSLYVLLTVLGLAWHVRYHLDAGVRSYLSTIALALAVMARPECYVLFAAAWLDRVLANRRGPARLAVAFLPHLLLYVLILTPYWVFNLSTIGSIFPATFHAKVQGGLFEALRIGDVRLLLDTLTGRPLDFLRQYVVFWAENNAVLLIPAFWGLVILVRRRAQTRSMVVPLAFVFVPLVVSVFSGWGELVGRYVANMIPLYAVLAAMGIEDMAARAGVMSVRLPSISARLVKTTILLAAVVNAGVVMAYASARYGWMVENINAMQVYVGHWVSDNIPRDVVIAVNDVGAIAYLGNHTIIDTVGLTTPDVIPYLKRPGHSRDENLLRYLQERQPDYLIIFPSWYPELAANRGVFEPVFTHTYAGRHNVTLGGPIMVVYRCRWEVE